MLQYLKIKDLALLDQVTLEFESGFTAVTGETGAGKSVLLGALGLLAGARTDKSLIRQGTDAVEVEAALYFEDSAEIDGLLDGAGLPVCEDGVLLLQRSIHKSKMPRIQINGSMATLTQLQNLGESWIDFHGPGEPQKLFQEKCQLRMLDAYAGNDKAVADYGTDYGVWRDALKEIAALETGERLDPDEIEFVQKQINKIDAVDLSEESIEALERDYTRMSSAQELVALASGCADAISGENGLSEQLSALVASFESLAELDPGSQSLYERVQSLLIELQDVGDEVGHLSSDFDFDPDTIEATTERMNLWQELRRKYGSSVEAVLGKREELAQKLAVQGDIEGVLEAKRAAAVKQKKQLEKQAQKITKARAKAAIVLSEKAAALLQALGFKKARLAIEMLSEKELTEHGDSGCRFLFSPNAGQDLLPLNKIASSGETARVMLALKTVLAEADATPLLVFDEVDANVGGEVGRAVGAELARLSGRHQVLCVTHLPQVASLAQNHFVVTKSQDDDSTTVAIGPIHESRENRLEELARMLGDRNSASARAHAEELLI
ncbi:MAG: DNA repair protein RecN [Opitutales bacterium]|jgi:DNA repair protein RecN (Recombination protein N)|nr:DNA repair protein RecN [Opitutales bacterium]MDP4643743.1 DNA repair protein RecN [Opitutales bacterium]MDP4777145.1 DNA repair protein RecN [Opitutales bacterium]MDP4883951.1 DNA repair protein RecN [Opitutales bacterium]MDP5080299.1 DNA repair protein RecN [Opitutales bacterium]